MDSYYYYFEAETGKVTITLNFKEKNKASVSLEQLTYFLNTINELHRRAIFITQPEYIKESDNIDNIDKILMLSYHQLKIDNVRRENPFLLTLSFRLIVGGVISYWVLWKTVIDIYKTNDKESSNLVNAIQEAFRAFESISSKLSQLKIDSKTNTALGLDHESNYEDSINKMKNKVITAIKNPHFKKHYDFLSLNSIMITDFISMFHPDKITDLKDLVKSIKDEQIIFFMDFSDK